MMKLVVLCCVLAVAAARAPVYFPPGVIPYPSAFGFGLPLQQPLYNYRGPLSLTPGQPANILAADGRPLDTLDVNLDRSAHFVAKALDNGSRVLKKRSVTRLAVAPGPDGYAAAVAAGNVGIVSPITVGPNGIAATVATNPVGLSTVPFAGASFTSPLAAASIGLTAPVVASPLAASLPITAGAIAAFAPLTAGPIAVSASGTPIVRNF